MPHSPYRKTVYPPIQNVDEYRRELAEHRASWEDDERDKCRDEMLLKIGEILVEHCEFLETKLDIKVLIHLLWALCQRWRTKSLTWRACVLVETRIRSTCQAK